MIKRLFDLFCSVTLFFFLMPLMLLLIILVYFDLKGPVFFYQRRPGLHGDIFTLIKFRTMTDGKTKDGVLLDDSKRLTRFGQLLRSTSLDELPSLINVIKGDMSLVGPRPLLVSYLPLYTKEQSRRHDVRPGVTGWAQVNGRNAITWEDKFEKDVWYVDNQSFWLDVKILFLTVQRVVKRQGISSDTHVTMESFKGQSNE